MDNRKITRSALSMSIVTFISRIFGLIREWLKGFLLGTSTGSDAFTLAFMFPNLLRRLVGEGAMIAAFVPVFSGFLKERNEKEVHEFVNSFFTMLFLVLAAAVALIVALAPLLRYLLPEFSKVEGKIELTVFLTRLMFPYILFISLAALNQGILNSYQQFIPSAATPILLNISIIATGLLLGLRMENPSKALGIGVLIGGALQFFFQLPFLKSRGIRYRFCFQFKNQGVRSVFLLMIPASIGAGVYQINALISQIIAASLPEGSVAALRFSNVLVELVLGVFIISISTVILPTLSQRSLHADLEGMKQSLAFALRLVFFITFPATFGLMLLRYPIVRMLFEYRRFTEESTSLVAYALLFHSIGLPGIGGTRVAVQMFYSMKDTKTPVYVATLSMGMNIFLCFLLKQRLLHGGIALAGSLASFFHFFLLLSLLRRRIGRIIDREVILSLMKTFIASVCMSFGLWFLLNIFSSMMNLKTANALFTLLLLLVGTALFLFINMFLKNRVLRELLMAMRKGDEDSHENRDSE